MTGIRQRTLAAALELERTLGSSRVFTDPEIIERYGADESDEPARLPDAVALPRTAAEAAAVIRAAAGRQVPITPRAGGTGKSGGAVPIHGGLVISCDRLASIVEIDPVDMVAVVEPGLVLARLHEQVENLGLFYPPDPASLESCCLGGNVAENAGGPRAFKYGVTSHYVLGVQVITPQGRILEVGHRPIKGVAGYDLARLFVGSEGTLGFISRITLRLIPKPEATCTLLAMFANSPAAGRSVGALLMAGLVPSVLEIMDTECTKAVRAHGAPVPPSAGALVMVELDGMQAVVEAQMQRVGDVLDSAGAITVIVATGAVEREALWRARRDISEDLGRRWARKLSDDISVPRRALVPTLEAIRCIGEKLGLTAATFGHAGDGNLHVNFMWDDPTHDSAALTAREEVLRMALDAGGTISGEHGIGSVKRHFLGQELGEDVMELSRGLKRLLDPGGIMNPGKVL